MFKNTIMKCLIVQFFIIAFLGYTSAQKISNNIVCSIDSLDPGFFNKNLFIFGEFHYHESKTSQYQLELINKLIKSNTKKIKIFFEGPPSGVYFLNEYFNKSDTELIDNPYVAYYLPFLNGLNKIKKRVRFEFIAMDLESYPERFGAYLFMQNLINKIPYTLYNQDVLDLKNAHCTNAIRKVAKKISSNKDKQLFFKKLIDSSSYNYFLQEINLVSKYGFIHESRTKKGINLRNLHMASIISKEYNDTVPCIATVGAFHLVPGKGGDCSVLIQSIKYPDRSKIALIPIIYKDSYFLDVGKEFYHTVSEFSKAVGDGIYDAVLIPCD